MSGTGSANSFDTGKEAAIAILDIWAPPSLGKPNTYSAKK